MTNRQCRHGFELSSCGNCMKDEIERLQRREQKAREILQPLADCDQAIRDWLAGSHHEPEGVRCIAAGCTNLSWKGAALCKEHHDKLAPVLRDDGPEDSTAREPSGPVASLCDGEVRLIYANGEPQGVRDDTGFLCHFNRVAKWLGQEERYRDELALRARQAEAIASALRTTQSRT